MHAKASRMAMRSQDCCRSDKEDKAPTFSGDCGRVSITGNASHRLQSNVFDAGDLGSSARSSAMLRYYTAGESHGETLVAFLAGMPAGLSIDQAFIDRELWRRQQGFGRGGRM